jgi:hypothetical protein
MKAADKFLTNDDLFYMSILKEIFSESFSRNLCYHLNLPPFGRNKFEKEAV